MILEGTSNKVLSSHNEKGGTVMARGDMSVREAGQKGGRTVSAKYGRGFYQKNGRKGGERLHDLVELGKQVEDLGE
jgi:general stress protein YciG